MDLASRLVKLPIASSNPIWNDLNRLVGYLKESHYYSDDVVSAVDNLEKQAQEYSVWEKALAQERNYDLKTSKDYLRRLRVYLKEVESEIKLTKNCLKHMNSHKYPKPQKLLLSEEIIELELIRAKVFKVVCDLEYQIHYKTKLASKV